MTTDHRTITMHLHRSSPPPTVHPHSSMPTKKSPNLRLFSFLQPFVMLFFISLFFLFVGIASIFVAHVLIAGRLYRHRQTRYHHHHNHHHHNLLLSLDDEFDSGSTGLSRDQIQKLPCCNYRSVLDSVSTRDCAVCLEGFREGEAFRILPRCRHVFHANCVEVWLGKASACPICRREVVESE